LSDMPAAMTPSLRLVRADLHVHTALSPCGSDEMTPPAIVATALGRGLDMIAICDHNTAGNVGAVQRAAEGRLAVLAGMEITSAEEVHVLGLFPDLPAAEEVAAQIRAQLPVADAGYFAFFGEQEILAADGHQTGTETACLALATPLDLNETVELIHAAGGLAVAAHIDRRAFSVFSQLGFFPHDAGFDGVEVSRYSRRGSPRLEEFMALGPPITASSDSHFLEEIGEAATELWVEEPTFAELALALAEADGRRVEGRVFAGGGIGGGGGAHA
jgi:PHP-associated/PHP domain